MNDEQIKRILETARTIATVGFSASPEKPSQRVPVYLMKHGYHVIPVNPTTGEILGHKAYPNLLAVPEKVDIVEIFRPSADVPPLVEQAIKIGASVVWMQEGIVNHEAAARAEAAGLQVVMDMCMRKEHRRLIRLSEPDHERE
jgi:uncharacterized protein